MALLGRRKISVFFKEIVIILTIKLVLIYGVWWFFFSSPKPKAIIKETFADAVFGPVIDRRDQEDDERSVIPAKAGIQEKREP